MTITTLLKYNSSYNSDSSYLGECSAKKNRDIESVLNWYKESKKGFGPNCRHGEKRIRYPDCELRYSLPGNPTEQVKE